MPEDAIAEPHVVRGSEAVSPLSQAIISDDLDTALRLLKAGADPNSAMAGDLTPLMIACVLDRAEAVSLLLARGAAPGATNEDGKTALILAAEHAGPELVRLLLEAGASADAGDMRGMTALMYAARVGRADVVQALVEGGSNLEAADREGFTALMHAAHGGRTTVVMRLIRAGAELDRISAGGATALMFAAPFGYPAIVRLLLAAGADPTVTDRHGRTALDYAVLHAQRQCVIRLLESRQDPKAQIRTVQWGELERALAPIRRRSQTWPKRADLIRLALRAMWSAADKYSAHGIVFGVLLADQTARRGAREVVKAAIDLLSEDDPRAVAGIQRDMPRILVLPSYKAPGGFDRLTSICVLNAGTGQLDPFNIAQVLVHESVHARLSRIGLGFAEGPERIRIERACYKRQREFAVRLGRGQDVIEGIEDVMARIPYLYTEAWNRSEDRAAYPNPVARGMARLVRWLRGDAPLRVRR